MSEAPTTWTVIYYQGTSRGWQRAMPVANEADASRQAITVERMGYPTVINPTAHWDDIGLPTGRPEWWDFGALMRKAAVPHYGQSQPIATRAGADDLCEQMGPRWHVTGCDGAFRVEMKPGWRVG